MYIHLFYKENRLTLDVFDFSITITSLYVWIYKKKFFNDFVIRPDSCSITILHSDMALSEIVIEINTLLPQLAKFINQFNATVTESGVNVFTDSLGSMSIDVPQSMSDELANKISNKIGIIDRLITTRGQEINELFQKGIPLENKLKMDNPNYVPQLRDKIEEFKRLNSLYKH